MDISYNKKNYKYEGMTLDSKPSTPEPPNTGKVIGSNDETEIKESFCKTTMNPRLTTITPTSI